MVASLSDSAFGSESPSIVRRAGLPAEAMFPLGSAACLAQSGALDSLEELLAELRRQLVEVLHAAVHTAPPEHRNLLLAAKRDCFNGRPLSRYRDRVAEWSILTAAAPQLAADLVAREQEHESASRAFEAGFEEERRREWQHLLGLLDADDFKRGLTLGSPDLVENLDRLLKGGSLSPRRLGRAEQSLLRYVSRASLKLSPFSTLTQVGLGLSSAAQVAAPIALLESSGREYQLRRYSWLNLTLVYCLLRRHPPFRGRLRVYLNDTVEPFGPGRYRLIRPFEWHYDEATREIRYFYESVVKISLAGPLVGELLANPDRRLTYRELQQSLESGTGMSAEEVAKALDRLLLAGFLLFELPWSSAELEPERCLRELLQEAPDRDTLSLELALLFTELEALMATEPTSGSLLSIRARLASLVRGAFDLLRQHLGLEDLQLAVDDKFHEDIFVTSSEPESRFGEIARISLDSARLALRSVEPLTAFSDLNYTRHEFLLSLQELARKRWPQRAKVPFLEVMNAAQDLWKEHVRISTAQISEARSESWNPFDLAAIRELQAVRSRVRADLMASLTADGQDFSYDSATAERAVEQIPAHLRSTFGPCLFLQPAAPGQDLWVLNHLLDGTGRFSTRYSKVMPADLRERFSRHFELRSNYRVGGDEAEVVDIFCSRADQLNVHALQTRRVLELPGECLQIPGERRLRVSDLSVGLSGLLPSLYDRGGQRILPIFLGATSLYPMPTLVKFLAQFSMPEFRLIYPQRPAESVGDTAYLGRIRIGNVILHRRLWTLAPAKVFGDIAALSAPELYRRVNRWRSAAGLPDQVFVAERLNTNFKLWELHKPQYIDFSSPSFLPILRACFEASPERLEIREMLPMPSAFPQSADGKHWALEIQLEERALKGPASPMTSTATATAMATAVEADADGWVAYHFFYHADPRILLRHFAETLTRELLEKRWVDRFFFVLYGLGGPHVRLRWRPTEGNAARVRVRVEEGARDFLKLWPAVARLDPEEIRQQSLRIRESAPEESELVYPNNCLVPFAFRPEWQRYGGAALMESSLEFFTLSSWRCLELLRLSENASAAARSTVAARTLLQQALGFAADSAEFFSLLSYRLPIGEKEVDAVLARADQAYAARPAVYQQLVLGELVELAPTAAPTWLRAAAAGFSVAIAAADAGSRWSIGTSQLHMTANRLGHSPAEELYLHRLLWLAAKEVAQSSSGAWQQVWGDQFGSRTAIANEELTPGEWLEEIYGQVRQTRAANTQREQP